MANRLLTQEELKLSIRELLDRVERSVGQYENRRIDRVLALKPDENGRIKYSDIRKANRGGV
jgi:hypothetical protein